MSNTNLPGEKKNDESEGGEGREGQSEEEEPSAPEKVQSPSEEKPSSDRIPPRSILSTQKKEAAESSASEEKKRKILRFALPDAAEEHRGGGSKSDRSDRSPMEVAAGSVNLSTAPFPSHKTVRVSDVLRGMRAATHKEASTSICQDGVTPPSFFHRTLVNMLRFETEREADSELLLSTHFRNLNGVVEALKMGANVNVVVDHQTPITLATENNDKLIVRHLLTVENINVNSRNIFGQTPLLIAVRNGYTEIATWLLNHNADVNLSDNLQRTPLHEALFQENTVLVQGILGRQCQLEKMDCFGEKPIYTAAVKKPNVDLLNELLRAGASCEYINEINGISLLSRAILSSLSYQIIQRLIEAGANVNEEDIFCKRTPLHIAAIINSTPIAKLLVEKGADPNLKTISGLTALDLAVYSMCFDIANYLAPITTSPNLNIEVLKRTLLRRPSGNAASSFNALNTGTRLSQLGK